MNIVLIPTRLNSTRLPGKAELTICGHTLVQYLIMAANQASNVDFVGLITTYRKQDIQFTSKYTSECFVYSYDGNENDVLGRFCSAVETIENREKTKVKNVIRLTHDCPLLAYHSYLIDDLITYHINNKCDFSHNRGEKGFPSGLDIEIMTRETIFDINKFATDEEREHVTLAIKNNANKYKIGEMTFENKKNYIDLFNTKWSIDTKEEYKKVSDVMRMHCLRGDIIYGEFRYINKFKVRLS